MKVFKWSFSSFKLKNFSCHLGVLVLFDDSVPKVRRLNPCVLSWLVIVFRFLGETQTNTLKNVLHGTKSRYEILRYVCHKMYMQISSAKI